MENLRKVINSRNAISEDQCNGREGQSHALHLVECSDTGFLGVYNPDPVEVNSRARSVLFFQTDL